MAYIDYILVWGKLVRRDEEPTDGYSLVYGHIKTYYEINSGTTTVTSDLTALFDINGQASNDNAPDWPWGQPPWGDIPWGIT